MIYSPNWRHANIWAPLARSLCFIHILITCRRRAPVSTWMLLKPSSGLWGAQTFAHCCRCYRATNWKYVLSQAGKQCFFDMLAFGIPPHYSESCNHVHIWQHYCTSHAFQISFPLPKNHRPISLSPWIRFLIKSKSASIGSVAVWEPVVWRDSEGATSGS